jgi:hypothetical protein
MTSLIQRLRRDRSHLYRGVSRRLQRHLAAGTLPPEVAEKLNNAISALQEASELLKRYDARDRSRPRYYQDEETLPKRAIKAAAQ